MYLLVQVSWQLLGLAWCTTAVGRVIGDAHWASDTLAGGFLALGAASVLSLCSDVILQPDLLHGSHQQGVKCDEGLGEPAGNALEIEKVSSNGVKESRRR